ncbi:glycosyltransferase 87 family protein [Actinoplanes sp. NPDC051470]|uniref:glycosyltransferase 87 family protein n=1 Tax=Actinoplanes sp. NPDC051470 TaxID=3157224 RepID=UPI00342FD644
MTAPSLYDFARGDAPFTYPPLAALLLRPLAEVPVPLLQTLWTLVTVAAVTVMAFLAVRAYVGHSGDAAPDDEPCGPRLTPNRLTSGLAGWVALALALSAPFSSNVRFGQVSVFLAVLVLIDLLVLRRTRWGGVLTGLAAAVKLTPLIFVALLFLAGRRRAAVTAAATFAVGTALGAVARPADSRRFWTSQIFDVGRLGHITSAGNQSLNGMLLRLHLPAEPRFLLALALGGAIAAAALRRAARAARAGDWLTAAIIAGAASIVLSPVSWTHHQFWLVLGILLPVRGHRARVAWIVLVIICMILPVTALGGPLWTNARLLLAIGISAVLCIRPVELPTLQRRPSAGTDRLGTTGGRR